MEPPKWLQAAPSRIREGSLLAQIILVPSVGQAVSTRNVPGGTEKPWDVPPLLHSACQKCQLPKSKLKSPGRCFGHTASPGTW